MDESQNLMWMKKKQVWNNSNIEATIPSSFGSIIKSSWEEKAFAEDAARIVGGCIWPPRSYSCHFCQREFRSAQALGGHMNVHRRDRARLKQTTLTTNHNELALRSHHNFTTSRFSSSSWPSTTQENCFDPNMSSSSIRWGNNNSQMEFGNGKEQVFKGLDYNEYVETSLSMGQNNSMFGQNLQNDDDSFEDKLGISYNKRPKTSSSVLLKPCLNERCLTFQSAEFVIGMEDLDLELRLGKLTQKA